MYGEVTKVKDGVVCFRPMCARAGVAVKAAGSLAPSVAQLRAQRIASATPVSEARGIMTFSGDRRSVVSGCGARHLRVGPVRFRDWVCSQSWSAPALVRIRGVSRGCVGPGALGVGRGGVAHGAGVEDPHDEAVRVAG
jgi:hypothetical protein